MRAFSRGSFSPWPSANTTRTRPPTTRSSRASSALRRGRRLPAQPAYEEPDASHELNALLQQTRAMRLDVDHVLGDDAGTIDDETIGEAIIEEPEMHATHQRQVLRRPGSSGSKPSSATGRARPRRW